MENKKRKRIVKRTTTLVACAKFDVDKTFEIPLKSETNKLVILQQQKVV